MLLVVLVTTDGDLTKETVKTQYIMKRSKTDKVIAGVCGGIGKATGINPWLFRILFLILGGGFWIYLLMWIFVEEEN
jgi:phage shock protein PspC (stress-responsive transcriptional regulator)